MLTVLIVAGWYARDFNVITPEKGIGYWLGIAGGSLMLLLLLYPLRKRIRFLHGLGATKHWFRMHMVFGLVGPLLILYHSNYQLGSFNSQVAFYCMLLVAGSGIIGRHFYAAIHRGLYGRKTSLQELQKDLKTSVEKSHGLAKFMPKLVARLDKLSAELQSDRIRQTIGIRRSLKWTFTHSLIRLSLMWTAHRELQVAAVRYPVVARERKRIYRTASRYIRDYTILTGRVAQYSFYERLFGLWHVLHLPIFFMMVLSALVHVLAVHMY
ncbi:MAG: hypothetical protein AMJ69_07125 [Gammaproteobacteria bacterium SG8_47]|nr:MAG: hypothetical protein AMJ69_07125 [Gammaproteobacteria bacterium SG8_47]